MKKFGKVMIVVLLMAVMTVPGNEKSEWSKEMTISCDMLHF